MAGIWIIYQAGDQSGPARAQWRSVCRAKSWTFVERPIDNIRDIDGRPIRLLMSNYVNDLYKAAHRDLILVIDTAKAIIGIDPSEGMNRITARRTMPLQRFVEYKVIYHKLNISDMLSNINLIVSQFESEIAFAGRVALNDMDPRALPFISFDLGDMISQDLELDTDKGRKNFDANFGSNRRRTDAKKRQWELNEYHGRDESMLVRGRKITPGFHWDVQSKNLTYLCTATEKWKMKPGQYLNVHTDMHIRSTKKDGGHKVWPEK